MEKNEGKLEGLTPVEIQRVRRKVEKQIRKGIPRQQVVDEFVNEYECSEKFAKIYYDRAMKQVKAFYEQYSKETAAINQARLDQIIYDALDSGNAKVAVMAIAEQNKMAHLYDPEVKIKQDGPIVVKFG